MRSCRLGRRTTGTRASLPGSPWASSTRRDGLAVEVLLEGPEREERGDLVVEVGVGHQHVAQVDDRVVLDVVHVAQAPQRGRIERLGAERVEVDVVDLHPIGALFQVGECELHGMCSYSSCDSDHQTISPTSVRCPRRSRCRAAVLVGERVLFEPDALHLRCQLPAHVGLPGDVRRHRRPGQEEAVPRRLPPALPLAARDPDHRPGPGRLERRPAASATPASRSRSRARSATRSSSTR